MCVSLSQPIRLMRCVFGRAYQRETRGSREGAKVMGSHALEGRWMDGWDDMGERWRERLGVGR